MIQNENIDNGAWILNINIKVGTNISSNIRSTSTSTTICINIYKQLSLGCFLQHLHPKLYRKMRVIASLDEVMKYVLTIGLEKL